MSISVTVNLTLIPSSVMAKSPPIIRSFFEPIPSPSQSAHKGHLPTLQTTTAANEGGLIEPKARKNTARLSPGHWQPRHDYEEVSIGELAPGPRRVSFIARVVNLYDDQNVHSKKSDSAKGCLKVLMKDDSALIQTNLWYADVPYQIRLGDLVAVWTTYVTSASSNPASADSSQAATLVTHIFPEREAGCAIRNANRSGLDQSVCNTPLGYVCGRSLFGLVSLTSFFDDKGDEVLNAKILVCVKAIGSMPTSTSKEGDPVRTLSVVICDESSEATLSISGPVVSSAILWKEHSTILLLSSPAKRLGHNLTITARTLIEINPNVSEAEHLRKWIQRENCPINEPFPVALFDIKAIAHAPIRLQFTLASLDSFIRAFPSQPHTGYLSVILTKLNLLSLWKTQQLFSMQCRCGQAIYANARSGHCAACNTSEIKLRINANLVSEMTDETGAISSTFLASTSHPPNPSKTTHTSSRTHSRKPSKILWTDEAWTQLLGRSPEQLAKLVDTCDAAQAQHNLSILRYLEQRLSFMRVILLVGWTGDDELGGRLAVLGVVG
ncbi:hypothetical protein EPUS_02621 [Endocarpon pusillum Z07020]|uniref:Uncharacterized protein n=1 Tax=Endocarpon pusillum (strain Z07020 / HMAS-L-300199) TaxID=1263415 RepID=U1I0Z7_ENDPU|nr:uncharacterized protein EPUS_02621 [Endocarpon pusillum Z07020]ERF76910.1 hypothetical protein EPUS_02621 [Endocarpon pusillum Z07020]